MLSLPSYDTIKTLAVTIWQGYRPTADTTPYSDVWLFSRVMARVESRAMKAIQRGIDAIFPTSTWGKYLDRWLYFRGMSNGSGGYGLITTRGSSGSEALTVTAIGASVDIQNYELSDTNGRTYKINESYSFAGAGTHDLDVASVSTGLATNLETGEILTFISPPANITAAATLVKDLTGGADAEEEDAGRARLVSGLQFPATAGNVADWVETIEAVQPGSLRAFVWPQRQNQPYGYGCTDYCALKTGESFTDRKIASSDDLYDDITDAVEARIPTLLMRDSRQLTLTDDVQTVELTLTMHPSATGDQLCDFDAKTINTTVAAETEVSLLIESTADICAPTVTNGLEAGHRVIIYGEEVVVTAVNVTGSAKKFTVESWPWTATTVTCTIMSGGGVIKTVEEAVRAYVDGIGPARGTYAAPLTTWDDVLRVKLIQAACITAADGVVIDAVVTDPAADATPAYGSGATAVLISVGEIIVWEQK